MRCWFLLKTGPCRQVQRDGLLFVFAFAFSYGAWVCLRDGLARGWSLFRCQLALFRFLFHCQIIGCFSFFIYSFVQYMYMSDFLSYFFFSSCIFLSLIFRYIFCFVFDILFYVT